MLNDDQITDSEVLAPDAAHSVPAAWVRDQAGKIGKRTRVEIEVIKALEAELRNYRQSLQDFAGACERTAKDTEPVLPSLVRAGRAREERLAQSEKVRVALAALSKAEAASATEVVGLSALVPWTDGPHGLKGRVDPDEPRRRR